MLANDPPAGTPVRILRDSRVGKMIRPLRSHVTDRAGDQFWIEMPDGTRVVVRRDEIE